MKCNPVTFEVLLRDVLHVPSLSADEIHSFQHKYARHTLDTVLDTLDSHCLLCALALTPNIQETGDDENHGLERRRLHSVFRREGLDIR